MKEVTGELNMTLVTVLAVAAILIFVTAFVPTILDQIKNNWNTNTTCTAEMRSKGICK